MTESTAEGNWASELDETSLVKTDSANGLLRVVNSAESELDAKQAWLERVQTAADWFNAYNFETDDDRKKAKKAHAEVRKFAASFKSAARRDAEAFTSGFYDDTRDVIAALDQLGEQINNKIAEFDKAYRDNKQQVITTLFDSYVGTEGQGGIEPTVKLEDVYDTRWLNRTVTDAAVQEQIETRVNAIIDLIDMLSGVRDIHVTQASNELRAHNWSTNEAWRSIKSAIEAEAAQQQLLSQLNINSSDDDYDDDGGDAVQPAKPVVRGREKTFQSFIVTIPESSLHMFKSIMNEEGWTFKRVSS